MDWWLPWHEVISTKNGYLFGSFRQQSQQEGVKTGVKTK